MLGNFEVFILDFFLPFILYFTILFYLLKSSKIFGDPREYVKDKSGRVVRNEFYNPSSKKIYLLISTLLSFLTVYYNPFGISFGYFLSQLFEGTFIALLFLIVLLMTTLGIGVVRGGGIGTGTFILGLCLTLLVFSNTGILNYFNLKFEVGEATNYYWLAILFILVILIYEITKFY